MGDAYEFAAEQHDSQAKQIARCVSKLKGSSRNSQLRVLAGLLEQLPQDAAALGSAKAREALLHCLSDRGVLHSKQKDVRMYAAACFAQLLRIYAPETPYEEKQLEPVFDLLLWSIEQVQEYQAPSYELAVSVLQSISQTKSYYIMLDWDREELVLDWVRALLQCINSGSSALAGPHALEVLVGILNDDGASEAVLEVLLSHLVPPKSQDNPLACQMAQAVLKACEANVKPALQKYLTTLILSPISSNSDLHQQCYTLIYQLYMTVPQVLLPVIPHLTSELSSDNASKRLEACQLLGRLLSLPGNKLVNEYRDVLEALLRGCADPLVNIRVTMLDFIPALVAAAGSEELQEQVLNAAVERLQDCDEKVRQAAVKAVCQAARQLLVGPPSSAATGPTGPGSANAVALLSPVDVLLGSIGSQELTEAAAADLDLAAAADLGGLSPAVAPAVVRDLQFVHEALKRVYYRLRDVKPAVRKAAASQFLSVFRAVVVAGEPEQTSKCCWLAARVILFCKSDRELRVHLVEALAKDGLFGHKTTPTQAAAAWVRLWLASSELERDALLLLLITRTRLQVETLQFLALRRKLSGRQAGADEGAKLSLEQACKQLAQQLPQPDRAVETLGQLLQVRDNNAFAAMQTALAPGASHEVYAKARADALARVGSRSPAAEAVGQLLLWGHPAAWLPTPVVSALLELVVGDPEGEQAELVQGAYQMLLAVGKAAPLLTAGLLPELYQLMLSSDTDLQQLGVELFARTAAQMRKTGQVLLSAKDTATAKLVRDQVLPAFRRLSRGLAPATAGTTDAEALGLDFDSQEARPVSVAPKAAKWSVFGLAACQDTSSTKRELEDLADELAGSLDPAAADTAPKLQALSVIGRLLPEALSRHMETLLHFVTDEYFNSYIDAAAGATDMQAAGSGGRRRHSVGSGSLLSPLSQGTGSLGGGSQATSAAGVLLKCAALKALAAACVPDQDSHDVPVNTLRVAVRLSEFLEGLLEPEEEARPLFLSEASPELCGELRLSAARALLRLARRHDTRMSASTYTTLALVMQDEQGGVRAQFAIKVYRLMRHFLVRPSSHQLSAKYAAMLPLAAADPISKNKVGAARLLRTWVGERRAAVQTQTHAAALGSHEGGSTLQDLPEMMLPYGLYILAHHPDFPQDELVDDVDSYAPFQYMLQFLLQPLLVACGSTPAGQTAPLLRKICSTLKRTADATEPPCTTQLYCLCDMAADTIQALAGTMQLQLSGMEQYAGGIILPKGLYRALDKAERVGEGLSYLPPGYAYSPDPETAPALAAGIATEAAAPAAHGKGTKSRAAAQGAAAARGGGRGSKRKAAAAEQQQQREGDDDAVQQPKRARAAAGAKGRSKGRNKAADADGDDGWGSDSEDAPPSAQKADQLTRRQQVLQQQQQLRQRAAAGFPDADHLDHQDDGGSDGGSADSGGDDGVDEQHGSRQQQQHKRQPTAKQAAAGKQAQQPKQQQRQMKQQQLTFAAAAAADASSPAPAKRSRPNLMPEESPQPEANGHAGGDSSSSGGGGGGGGAGRQHDDDGGEGSSGESPGPVPNAPSGQQQSGRGRKAQQQQEQARGGKRQHVQEQQQQQQRSTPRGRQARGRGAALAAADAADGQAADADGDVAMDEDQEHSQPTPATRAKPAAARGAAGAAKREAGKGQTAGRGTAAARKGRSTRQTAG